MVKARALSQVAAAVAVAFAVLGSGCTVWLTRAATVRVEPDGRAKVELDWRGACDGTGAPGAEARRAVAELLAAATGVEAWRDVRVDAADLEGVRALRFRGTAYVRDLAGFRIDGKPFVALGVPSWSAGPRGGELRLTDPKPPATGPAPRRSPAERREAAARARSLFREQVRVGGPLARQFLEDVVFVLPGRLGRVDGMERVPGRPQAVRFAWSFDALRADAGALEGEAPYWEALVDRYGDEELEEGGALLREGLERVLGRPWPYVAEVVAPLRRGFDWDAEVARARRAAPRLGRRLGLDGAAFLDAPSNR